MWNQLKTIAQRFEAIGAELGSPEVAADPRRYQTLAKEHAQFRPIVENFFAYQHCQSALEKNQQLLQSESDPDMQAMVKEDIAALQVRVTALERALQLQLLPKDPNDDRNVILEIRGGAGGDEAALFAGSLWRMYSRFAELKRWRVEVLDSSPTGLGGMKDIVAMIQGAGAYSVLKYESGVHRVQRVPKTEASGRIHTSTVTVAVLPEADDVEIDVRESDLRIDVFRASGPGGQGVNTTDSAVRITHAPSGIVVTCRDERSQIKNKAKAMKILRARLLEREQQAQASAISSSRREQVGSGDRSEKIRTYNFPQSRVTDHRIGLTLHQLDSIMNGELDPLIDAVRNFYQAAALKSTS